MAGSRDFATGDYLNAGAAANLAQTNSMTIAALVKVDAIPAWTQDIVSRVITTFANGWEFQIKPTTGFLHYRLAESDDAPATSTTAVTAGTWFGVAVVTTGVDGAGSAHFVRFTPSTGALASENIGFFNAPGPAGTFTAMIGGVWDGAVNQRPYAGEMARVGVWAGVALSDDELKAWFCSGSAASGADGLWALNGTASPEPDTSGNGYDATLSGTTEGTAPDGCPNRSNLSRGLIVPGMNTYGIGGPLS